MARPELNILITCANRRVALIDAFRRALDLAGAAGRVIAVEATAASPTYYLADEGVILPLVKDPAFLPAMLEAARRYAPCVIVPVTDLDIPLLAAHTEQFRAVGATPAVGSAQAVALCRDKTRMGELLVRAGLEDLPSLGLEAFEAGPFFPCFVKPADGSAGIGAAVIRDRAQLDVHLGRFGRGVVIQEWVEGQEFTIDVYRTRAGQVRCVVPRQRLAVRSGEVEKGVTRLDRRLVDDTVKLASACEGLWGVFCCQCRRAHESAPPRFFEINPRFGGGCLLSIRAGANLPLYLVQDVLGLEVTARLGEFTDRLLMLRYDEAAYVQVDDAARLPGFDTPTFR